MVSGKTRTMDFDITPLQMQLWESGESIQNAMPNLTADEREFVMTGTTSDEWDSMFKEDDEHDDREFDKPE